MDIHNVNTKKNCIRKKEKKRKEKKRKEKKLLEIQRKEGRKKLLQIQRKKEFIGNKKKERIYWKYK